MFLRATGVVRRIDDLGRIVIPKEIRRTMRIKEGNPLEVYVDKGAIVLKRYAPLNTLEDHADEYVESLQENLKCIALVSDESNILAVAGGSKANYMNKPIGDEVERAFEEGKTVLETKKGKYGIIDGSELEQSSYVICPIMINEKAIGSVILLSKKENQIFGEVERKMAELAANFLGTRLNLKEKTYY